jgi:hypothetical protein
MTRLTRWGAVAFVAHFAFDAALLLGGLALLRPEEVSVVRLDPIVVTDPPDRLSALTDRMGGNKEIAAAILLESDRSGVPVDLIVGIMRTENAPLDPDTVNWYGATGLMQVWDHHTGAYAAVCGDGPLTDIRTNVCYGVEILTEKLQVVGGDTLTALLLYNGCWGVSFDSGCATYPATVMTNSQEDTP